MSQTSILYRYSAAVQGFILWSSWAFYVNSKVSFTAGIKAGFVQGAFSFCSTLIVISLLTRMYNYFQSPFSKLIVPPVIMVICLSLILISVHTIAGTPQIATTITPSLTVAMLFCSFTIYKLKP